jgi:probable rRNA maturation factor
MIDVDNRTEFIPDMTNIEMMTEALNAGDIELVICDDTQMRAYNRDYRGIDKATDVLSFPYAPMPMVPIGSIVISADHVKEGAESFGHCENDEFTLLFLHGLLHLLGYDHETDRGEMRQKEEEMIALLQLPSSLIVRTEGEI